MKWVILTLTFFYTPLPVAKSEIAYAVTLPEVTVTAKALPNEHDWQLLARLIYAEARGESFKGKRAVADVVINIAAYKHWSIHQTIFDKGRFDGIHTKAFNATPCAQSLEAARLALTGKNILPPSVMFFYNPTISTDTAWISYIKKYAYQQIENHLFCHHPKYNNTRI